ncbi:MAG: hypothetical protein ACXAEU_17630 [Candidatus Hodarchaeales archaeon]|jgi:Zn-dependent protease
MKYDDLIEKKSILDRLQLSGREVQELIVAWLLLSVTFVGFRIGLFTNFDILMFLSMILVFGAAFIFHELGHKYAAISLGGRAEFRLDSRGMLITIFSMLMGFGILVPGAVFWSSEYGRYSNIRGRVSATGPLMNMAMSAIFLTLLSLHNLLFQITSSGDFVDVYVFVLYQGFRLNLLLGVFNLLPVWILDGKKILDASTNLWIVLIIGFLGMYMFAFTVIGFSFGINFGFIQI